LPARARSDRGVSGPARPGPRCLRPGQTCRRAPRDPEGQPSRGGCAGGADPGGGRRAHDQPGVHATAEAPHENLRRPASVRRGPDRLGSDGTAVGARAIRSPPPARRGHLGEEGAERRAVRERGAGDVLPGGEEVQHHLGGRLGRDGAAAGHPRPARSRPGRAHGTTPGPEVRVGALECPLDAIEVIDVGPDRFAEYRGEIMAVEVERYGGTLQYPPDVLRAGRRPLLQFPPEMLQSTLANPGALCVVLRDRVSGRVVAYAIGSALEQHDEEGVSSDPRLGEKDTFYLQAMATLPSVKNHLEIENLLLERL